MRGVQKYGYYNSTVHSGRHGVKAVMGYYPGPYHSLKGRTTKSIGLGDGIPIDEAEEFKEWFCKTYNCELLAVHCEVNESKQKAYPEILAPNIVVRVLLLDAGILEPSDDERAKDLMKICEQPNLDETTKETLVDARLGQGKFRKRVLELWDNRCAVTGAATVDAIRASHIKPWSESTNIERLDPRNGLPLVATLDALFDAGLISFEASGQMKFAEILDDAEPEILGIVGKALRNPPSDETREYLEYHWNEVFQG